VLSPVFLGLQTSINHDDLLPSADPKWCTNCDVSLQFDPLYSIANLRSWWKLRSFHVLMANSMVSYMTAQLGVALLLFFVGALIVLYEIVQTASSNVPDTTAFLGYLCACILVLALQPFLTTIRINESYNRQHLDALAASMVVCTQHMANLVSTPPQRETKICIARRLTFSFATGRSECRAAPLSGAG
jgi:hypothetical protein